MSFIIYKKQCRSYQACTMRCSFFLFALFILPLVACPLWGQALQKKALLPHQYHQWGELILENISDDQKWTSFKIEYEHGSDSLFVRNIFTSQSFAFQNGENGRFFNGFFVCMTGRNLHILNLATGTKEIIKDIKSYTVNVKEKQLIYLCTTPQNNALEILCLKTGKTKKISDAVDFLLSPDQKNLWFTVSSQNNNAAAVINLENLDSVNWLVKKCSEKFISAVWQKHGMAVAFIKECNNPADNRIFSYNLREKKISELNSETDSTFFKSFHIISNSKRPIIISDDLQSIFFCTKSNTVVLPKDDKSAVEVWNTHDKWIYPREKTQQRILDKSILALWNLDTGSVTQLTTNEQPEIMTDGDMKFAYLSNSKIYEPQFEYEGPRDFYALNLKTFEKKIFLEKQTWNIEALNPSPGGKYFAYFKENNWWIYNPKNHTHTNITESLGEIFYGKKQELVPQSVYGNPGWTTNDKQIILYDKYDVWSIDPDGKNAVRLTKGREKQITFRIINPGNSIVKKIYDGPLLQTFDLSKSLILRANSPDGKSGIFLWNKDKREKQLLFRDSSIDQFKFLENPQQILFREQTFEQSPSLHSLNISTLSEKTIFKSNTQQGKYYWGKSELIEFQNSKGDNLKGVLLYPANYSPKKKYPMIVNIYEKKAYELHIYLNPSLYNGGGFNTTLMTLNDYFVFLPDIQAEYQNPGISALDCVTSAVRKVISKDIVDPNKIGLIGHSWGGYESSFITTQTSMFAASVAGGPITDLVSYYYNVGRLGNPNIWRFEKEQWNMGGSPAQFPEHYIANSPIMHVSKIEKPLLLWSGKNDQQVDSRQCQELYLALRRLNKKGTLILYPDEGHVLINSDYQKDITLKILEWFNYFLKDDHNYSWITDSTQ